ncbi:MAG: hypothetical protein U0L57_05180 [Bacteroidales bacterium]|jgi:hypothetical protein|nr:hypothetical protein [Bacteroidales bacterium]
MKKLICFICILFGMNVLLAQQPPRPPEKPRTGAIGGGYDNTRLRGERAPITPATLLLLGLGGATVGATIIRNTKKGGK